MHTWYDVVELKNLLYPMERENLQQPIMQNLLGK